MKGTFSNDENVTFSNINQIFKGGNMKFKRILTFISILLLPFVAYGYYSDFSSPIGSFEARATGGMFYQDVDVLYRSPVRLWEFQGTLLLTSFGNYDHYNDFIVLGGAINTNLKWGTQDDTFFSIGVIGKPLWFLGNNDIRGGIYAFQYGSKSVAYDLDNDIDTGFDPSVQGLDSEGYYKRITLNDNGDGLGNPGDNTNDMTDTFEAKDMIYHRDTSRRSIIGGATYKFSESIKLGVGLLLDKNENILTTGGEKTYTEVIVKPDPVLLADISLTAKYLEQGDTDAYNSTNTYALGLQGQYKLSDEMQADVLLDLAYVSKVNPLGWEIDAIDVSYSEENTDVEETDIGIFNRSILDYDIFGIPGALIDGNPGTKPLATTKFEDNRSGIDIAITPELNYTYDKMLLIDLIINFSTRLGMGIDASREQKLTLDTADRVAATTLDDYSYSQTRDITYDNGSESKFAIGGGTKLDFLNLKDIKLAIGLFFQYKSAGENYTYEQKNETTWTYDDGLTAVTPFLTQPGTGANGGDGEGTMNETSTTGYDYTRNISKTEWTIPVGTIIKLSKKWDFKAGARYVKTYTKTVEKTEKPSDSGTTTVSKPLGQAETTVTALVLAPQTERESTLYEEASYTEFAYGVSYNYNENLRIAINAFLETNPGGNLLDLATYRNLAISATYKL